MKHDHKKSKGLKPNYEIVMKMIEENSSVLDVGCGDGELLKELVDTKNVDGLGIEIDQNSVIKSLEKGLQVVQCNIDDGLKEFSKGQWDYVILNQTLQSTRKPDFVIEEMLKVGKKVIVSFPNFAYWKVRFYLFFKGMMPKSDFLPFEWYNTPNIHLLTVKDFFEFCKKRDIKIEKSVFCRNGSVKKIIIKFFENILSEEAIFLISK